MLQSGDIAPAFSLPDADMEMFDLASVVGKQNVVLYFYPRDKTPGCTRQAADFSDHEDEFARFDCIVDLGSGKIDNVTAVAADEVMPNEGQPLWLPAGNGPPILDCGRVERVMVGGDAVAGYLHYTDGC